jgi:hypothetical protein
MKNALRIIPLVLLMARGGAAYTLSPGTGYPPDLGGPNIDAPITTPSLMNAT